MKRTFLALAVAAPLALSLASLAARADTDVGDRLNFGEHYYDHRVGPRLHLSKGIWLVSVTRRDASTPDLRRSTFHRAQARIRQHIGERLSRNNRCLPDLEEWKAAHCLCEPANRRDVARLTIETKPTPTASGRTQPATPITGKESCVVYCCGSSDCRFRSSSFSISFMRSERAFTPRPISRIACQPDATA